MTRRFSLSTPVVAISVTVAFGLGCGNTRPPEIATTKGQPLPDAGAPASDATLAADGDDAGLAAAAPKLILVVVSGLRPESITPSRMKHLDELRRQGVELTDMHAVFPTTTMVNAATLATGVSPGRHGLVGSVIYHPALVGTDGWGRILDGRKPTAIEDDSTLRALFAAGGRQVPTLWHIANRAGLTTLAVGRAGAVTLLDPSASAQRVDEHTAWPRALADRLQERPALFLPRRVWLSYPGTAPSDWRLVPNDLAGLVKPELMRLEPGGQDQSANATIAAGSTASHGRRYFEELLTGPHAPDGSLSRDRWLGQERPADVICLWLSDPGSTQDVYGVGAETSVIATTEVDWTIARLRALIDRLGWRERTNLVVMSDRGASSVAGPEELFPLRATDFEAGSAAFVVGAPKADGQAVSGEVRLASIIARFTSAYDGQTYVHSEILSGVLPPKPDRPVPTLYSRVVEPGSNRTYTTKLPLIPSELPSGSVIVAENRGSALLYVAGGRQQDVVRLTRFLQSRSEVGAIFVADRHGRVPGALPLSAVNLDSHGTPGQTPAPGAPDLLVSYSWDADAIVAGAAATPGTSYSSMLTLRGTHGSFSPRDVRSVFIAAGPAFKKGLRSEVPAGVIDVAPTLARALGLEMPSAEGRALLEILADSGVQAGDYVVSRALMSPGDEAQDLAVASPLDIDESVPTAPLPGLSRYTVEVQMATVTLDGKSHSYFDWARAVRR